MNAGNGSRFPWRVFFSELVGTALLLLVGLSLVIVMFGTGSPMVRLIPNEGLRRLIPGFLSGTTGATIALSAVGKESGAHINPVATMVFWLFHRLPCGAHEIKDWHPTFRRIESLLRTSDFRTYSHNLMSYNRLCRFKASHHHLGAGLLIPSSPWEGDSHQCPLFPNPDL
jgi:hypothetical protein